MKTTTSGLQAARTIGTVFLVCCISSSAAALLSEVATPVALTLKGEWPGYARGDAQDVEIQGPYAYVAIGYGGMQVIDVSSPDTPRRVGGVYLDEDSMSGDGATRIAASGDHAYVLVGGKGLQVIEVTDPANPRRMSTLSLNGWANDVTVSDRYAYVVGEGGYDPETKMIMGLLQVIDVADPANPRRLGECTIGGTGHGVVVSGQYVYVACGLDLTGPPRFTAVLQVVDISDPANPRLAGGYRAEGYARGVAVAGDYALVAEGRQSHGWSAEGVATLHLLDISNPTDPKLAGKFTSSGRDRLLFESVAVAGNYACLTTSTAFYVIDISNPANPHLVGEYGTHTDIFGPAGLAVADNFAYVANPVDGLQVIDITNPATPQGVGAYNTAGDAVAVAVSGNYAYLADLKSGLHVINVTDPASPWHVGNSKTSDASEWFQSLVVSGQYVCLESGRSAGLQVIDVSDPANPRQVGGCDTSGGAGGVTVSGNYAYVADWEAGLQVIDISSPSNPQRVGGFPTRGTANDVAVVGNYAYVAEGDGWASGPGHEGGPDQGVEVLDITNPASPSLLGRYDSDGFALGIAVSANHAYVADDRAGLQVIDISNPANPHRVGGYAMSDSGAPGIWFQDVVVSGRYAYVAHGDLQIIDISDPENPHRAGRYHGNGRAQSLVLSGNLIYVADRTWGLRIFEQSRGLSVRVSGHNPPVFSVSGEQGTAVRLQRSSNLRDWENWQSGVLGETPLHFSDPDAGGVSRRFYRAVRP